MNQIIKITLLLIALLQVILSEAKPRTTEEASTTLTTITPGKDDILYDFLLDKYNDKFTAILVETAAAQCKMYQSTIVFLETKLAAGDETIDSKTLQDFKGNVEHLVESVDKLKADKSNCLLFADVGQQFSQLGDRFDAYRVYDELVAARENMIMANRIYISQKNAELVEELREQAPAIISIFREGLSDVEKQSFDDLVTESSNDIYSALSVMYQNKKVENNNDNMCAVDDITRVVLVINLMVAAKSEA